MNKEFQQYLKDTETQEVSEARAFKEGYERGRAAANSVLLKEVQLCSAHRDAANARYDALIKRHNELRIDYNVLKISRGGC